MTRAYGFQAEYDRLRGMTEDALGTLFTGDTPWQDLQRAMAYSVRAGGKRVRPVLTLAFCAAAGGTPEQAVPFGVGVELLHTYSLIHDDLPCMDDDDLRRGVPTCHVRFGEWQALLAGDALQCAAFEQILSAPLPDSVRAQAALELARQAGGDGLCAGQQLDLAGEGRALTLEELRQIHGKKTGALLECACVLGVLAAGGAERLVSAARDYAREIGLAFQIRDDLLDGTSTTRELGKRAGMDQSRRKTTFFTLLGAQACQREIDACTARARAAAADAFPEAPFLGDMADWLAGRNR